MNKTHSKTECRNTFFKKTTRRAFTLVEVIVALVVVSIALLGLIRMHIISIKMIDSAQISAQAVLLAQEKIEETLADGYPAQGTDSGSVQKNVLCFDWQTEVVDSQLSHFNQRAISGLRNITADVSWKQGNHTKHLQMSTCVADRKLQ